MADDTDSVDRPTLYNSLAIQGEYFGELVSLNCGYASDRRPDDIGPGQRPELPHNALLAKLNIKIKASQACVMDVNKKLASPEGYTLTIVRESGVKRVDGWGSKRR